MIVKHTNPCGAATRSDDLLEAYRLAVSHATGYVWLGKSCAVEQHIAHLMEDKQAMACCTSDPAHLAMCAY